MKNFLKVKQLENKNQFIIESEKGTFFQSYRSLIANYYCGKLTLGKYWDYSKTTLKHLYIYLYNYCWGLYYSLGLGTSKNKKATIQKAIDNNIIFYDKEME